MKANLKSTVAQLRSKEGLRKVRLQIIWHIVKIYNAYLYSVNKITVSHSKWKTVVAYCHTGL